MKVEKFEELIAWQKAQDLAVEIYERFGKSKDFGFKNQICRASISISNNVAEGFDRKSNKEFVYFLYVALGSTSEVKSILYLAERLNYISNTEKKGLIKRTTEIGKIIYGLIRSIN